MKDTADLIIGLFKELKLPLRWIAVIVSVILFVLGVLGYEHLTGHFYYGRLEKKIALLKELQLIANEGIASNQELYPIYQSAVEELTHYEVRGLPFPPLPSVSFGDPVTWGKAISGASVWLLFLIVGVSSDVKKAGRISGATIGAAVLVIIIATVFAWVGTIIPTIFSPWVNYIGFPAIQSALFFLLFRKKKPAGTKG
ncbi:MAG: hypothetical protein E3J21_13990 [Anaerolineales bacterium]|nr:MAG: hypothetical protein E3J21_13990 [Anaerolineales bacterium]